MEIYEKAALAELEAWKKKLLKRPGRFNRLSRKAQQKMSEVIPEKAHELITESMKGLVKGVLAGSEYLTKEKDVSLLTLEQKERWVRDKIETYKKTATIEGAGTGAAGIFLSLADFPLLLTIKMKFLFEAVSLYGFDVNDYTERLFILHVFQLAFSSEAKRLETLNILENWDERKGTISELNWKTFQQEYRDYIDIMKMCQFIPGIGAVVGAYANYHLLQHLGETVMNCCRIRLLTEKVVKE
ncbi:EcsC family protein [Bacillus sp. V5-8f]|uniref:EcsC family protein n=1 Tax=Bacillus sp. V5-8f TaxID=2053044 RepID=UPI000C758183|nr:EcsC family protein [Bacillus sp. V5-8f]PLT33801.1 ABC transporter-associated protein EcsC [Bacillus sp. V5-8f]